ncbi:DUF3560 domain-containing protein [Dehalobacter sp. TeCB1]|uniref:DUF3560 domain-containing protein n=1 Tax=Dehalobacter sp. TeCB1 TaxID=1843715 RepID=UPI00083A5022|nr:DUF3560 domain-containing protein [Dehalobacter sp. TeCB1]OCZ51372.1 hypothetical protein A7D23_13200 [Dehalobacter sp. TeCB1]
MGKYILNQETQKFELHFDKAEYMALSESQKKEIKSNFLWSRTAGAWVSRSIHHHYRAVQIAEKLGLENGGKEGQRLSYAEELERKQERAEARAERFETYSENAEKRGKVMTSALDPYRGDIAFFTQPIIAGHSGSQAFARQRERLYARVHKGFEEYRKSEYFADRAATARATADASQLKKPIYLHNRIKEQNALIKKLEGYIADYENTLYKIEQGEAVKNYKGEILTTERIEKAIENCIEKMEYEIDKLAFFQNCMDEIGGNKFGRENIKVGYVVKIARWGRCLILTAGPVNVTYKILDGGASGGILTDPYAAIVEILEANEIKKETSKVENPYQVGDILCNYGVGGNKYIRRAYQVIKTTDTGVKLQRIKVENNEPIPGQFIEDKAVQRKITKSKWNDFVGVYDGDWQLHKYTA